VNTPVGRESVEDEKAIRLAAIRQRVPCVTTMSAFHSLVLGLASLDGKALGVIPIQSCTARRAHGCAMNKKVGEVVDR
jgi:carbamoyl-phosphate synthase large subunit